MLQAWREQLLFRALLPVVLICGGCAVDTSVEHRASEYVPAEVQLGSASPVVSESQIDSRNRFLSTVKVETTFRVPGQGSRIRTCSGVVVHPRVVLTAGHCVCHERKSVPPEASNTSFVDRSTCARTAAITLFRYGNAGNAIQDGADASPQKLRAEEEGPYRGTIQPHEDIRIVYKEAETGAGWEANMEHSDADLAVIVLDRSLQGLVEPTRLAERPVRLEERVVLVGFGPEHFEGGVAGRHRRYGENEVASIKEDGTTFHIGRQIKIAPSYGGEKPDLLRRRGSYAMNGDSGGPCFRERKGAMELVGIARSTHGPPLVLSVYTSTYKYMDWLRGKIREAETLPTD